MKKLLAFLLSLTLIFSFAACNKNSEDPVSFLEEDTITVKAEKDVFPENTVVTAQKISEGENYNTVSIALKATAAKFEAYDITAKSENVSVQPNGTVQATFDIPEGFDLDRVSVVYISDDGKIETLSSDVDKESRTVTAELSHFSFYAVIEAMEADTAPENAQSEVAESEDAESEKTESDIASSSSNTPEESSKPAESSKPTEPSKPAECVHKYTDATCTVAKTCSLCKKTEGAALGHDYVQGICSRCKSADATYKAITSDAWTVQAVSGGKLFDYEFCFGNDEPFLSVGIGENIKDFDQEFKNEILSGVYGDSVYTIDGNTYYIGMGDGCPISYTVNKNTVVVTDMDTNDSITIERTSGTTYTVTVPSTDSEGTFAALKKGSVLCWEEAIIAED